jgi:hypothetical protein
MQLQVYRGSMMRNLLLVGLLLAMVMPTLALGQSDFDGTWKIDLSKSELPSKLEVFLLQSGTYQCKSCVPMIKVKADGTDQSVSGSLSEPILALC